MTVSSTTTKDSYSGDGSTTVFAYTFKIFDEDDITVIVRTDATGVETVKTKTTDYTVSGVGNANGGNITFGTAPISGETVVLLRDTAQTQTTDYTPNDPFPAAAHEDALDRVTFIAQEIQEELDRAIKVSKTNTITSPEFTTSAADRANKVFAFDSNGDLSVAQELGTYRGTDATTTTSAYNERDLIKSTTAGQLDNVYIALQDSPSGTLLTNTSYWALVVDAVSAATSATNASNSADDAEKLAINAEDSQFTLSDGTTTGYSALHHKEKALDAQTAAETAETNAQDWAVKTNGIVDSTDYSAKAWSIGGTGVTNASGAGPAKDWAVETTGQVDGTEYSAKEYAVGTQTRGTTGSAKDWATYTAGTVDGSGYSAKYWAEQAAASADNFDDTYLGPKSADPSVDNDGDPLNAGDLYFNTTTNTMRVYSGTAWQDAAVSTAGFASNGFAIAMAIAL